MSSNSPNEGGGPAETSQIGHVRTGDQPEATGEGGSRTPSGAPVTESETLARIRALAIPPAWRETWICPDPHGHIQAVGIGAAERRQYGCHDPWRARRDQAKFEHMIEFGRALPQLGERASAHLAQRGFPKERILAARLAWPGKRSQTR